MKPHVICHMMVSLDGRIHPSRWTASPDGNRQDWTKVYEDVHGTLAGDAWLVGRVTTGDLAGDRGRVGRPLAHLAHRHAPDQPRDDAHEGRCDERGQQEPDRERADELVEVHARQP